MPRRHPSLDALKQKTVAIMAGGASSANAAVSQRSAARFAALMTSDDESSASPVVAEQVTVAPTDSVPVSAPENTAGPQAEDISAGDEWSTATGARHTRHGGGARAAHDAGDGFRRMTKQPVSGVARHAPLSIDQLCAERTLEVYSFPAAWRTADLRKFVGTAGPAPYRLKWQDDTSCWVHYESADAAAAALAAFAAAPESEASVRSFAPENVRVAKPAVE